MRDPRLAEIAFLSALEREPMKFAIGHDSREGRFGLSSGNATREMLFEMIAEHLVNGPASALNPHTAENPIDAAQDFAWRDSTEMRAGLEVAYRITHKGRVHLWRRRDELRSDRGREAFGILYDRRTWDRMLPVELLFAGVAGPLSLLFLDLDHFKMVNDTRGHVEGDIVLRRWFEIVADVAGDHGYRYGGEEVCVLLAGNDLETATRIAEAIRVNVEKEFADRVPPSTVSIGVAAFDGPVEPNRAVDFVDGLLYVAKHGGRNRVAAARFDGKTT
jgi:diguanylate cyclase (GGDEF)-like protein